MSVFVSVSVSVSVHTCLHPSDNRYWLCGLRVRVCVCVCVFHAEKSEIEGGRETRDRKERYRECHPCFLFLFFSGMSRIGNAKDNDSDSQRERSTLVCLSVSVSVTVSVSVSVSFCVYGESQRERGAHAQI